MDMSSDDICFDRSYRAPSACTVTDEDDAAIGDEVGNSDFLLEMMQDYKNELAGSDTDSESETENEEIEKNEVPKPHIAINDNGDKVIEMLDAEKEGFVVHIKQEPAYEDFHWKEMADTGPIVVPDSDEENEGSVVPIKQEPVDANSHGKAIPGTGPIVILDSDDEKPTTVKNPLSIPHATGRRPHDLEKMMQLQRLHAARALEGRRVARGANGVFNILQPSNNGNWMRQKPTEVEESKISFSESKRQYKAKRKAKKNSIMDDIAFKKAQDMEKARIRKLEASMHDMDSSEAEESDDCLFLPDSTPASHQGLDADGGKGTTGGPKSKRQKHTAKPTRTQAELRNELYHNLMAGYEAEAAKDYRKEEFESIQADKAEKQENRRKKKAQKNVNTKYTDQLRKGQRPGRSSKAKQSAINLTTSNIYDESNANIQKSALPTMHSKEKRRAMVDLVASIDLEESQRSQATTDRNKVIKATTTLGNCRVNENHASGEGDWNLKGMSSALFHHQVLGVALMKDRENGERLPLGGLLAYEMGFGKTLMSMANMIANPPAPTEEQRCTLIIASRSIISQWDNEINIHTTGKNSLLGSIIRHFGDQHISDKGASGRNAAKILEKAGIVLSTYQEVIKSYPKCAIPEDLQKKEPIKKMEWWKDEWEKKRGLLHRVQFYRVILDEAQVIKNHRAHTSIACRALMAKHRWAVTATPILNSIEELYPYFKFLRVPLTGSYRTFKQNFCETNSIVYNQRLHSLLDQILIRKTHKDELFGTAIVKLPENHQATVRLKFNDVERMIYEVIKENFIERVNAAKPQFGYTDEDRSKLVLVLILRLRQMTSHLFMLQAVMEEIFSVEDIEDLWSATITEATPSDSDCSRMVKALREMIKAKDVKSDKPIKDNSSKTVKKRKNEPGNIYQFRQCLRSLRDNDKWAELKERIRCHRCKLPPESPMLTSCLHIYCADCLTGMALDTAQTNEEHTKCIECNEAFTSSSPCKGLKELEELEADAAPPLISAEAPTANTHGGRDENAPKRRHRTLKENMKWVTMDDNILPSTKTAAVVAQIDEWLSQFPTQKIIVFSQFHLIFQVLGKECEKKRWQSCQYHGQMSPKAREEALESFRDDPEVKIMIASLKCGGVGLNLTMACRVICVDLWFNSGVEQQAFCRVLRIGQKQETYITRFCVEDSIDESLLKLQARKDVIISAAMDDRTVLNELSLEQLMGLFGEVRRDDNAEPFIFMKERNMAKRWGPIKEKEAVVVEEDEEGTVRGEEPAQGGPEVRAEEEKGEEEHQEEEGGEEEEEEGGEEEE